MHAQDIKQARNNADKKVLMVLSNICYSKQEIYEDLVRKCLDIMPAQYNDLISDEFDDVLGLMETLENMVFDSYVRRKILTLNKLMKSCLMRGEVKWEDAAEPVEVRNLIREFLVELVFVHQQVFSTAEAEAKAVFERLMEKLMDNYYDYLKQVDRFSPNGALQFASRNRFYEREPWEVLFSTLL
eukprot:TRINITY_DN11188_c0_g1_i1.p1 TRINITY_DN11188_c0_g1~~TRINITY_DN11188_c0_g1_i1.p1  ORF type:complete len:211 (-),score=64.43 TRINITY_DN11188_c0_g1_i1:250-804(-)